MRGRKIKILFAASEMAPLAKVGGLGDVIGSLPKTLKKMEVDTEVVIPRYGHISKKNLKLIFLCVFIFSVSRLILSSIMV